MSTAKRSPGLKVVGAGLPRTSTFSLRAALEQLGFDPCYHVMTHIMPSSSEQKRWIEICNTADAPTRQKLLRDLYESPNHPTGAPLAAVDAPTCFFTTDFLALYPDVKVILSVRDTPSAWYKSFITTIGKTYKKPSLFIIGIWVPFLHLYFAWNEAWNKVCRGRYGVDARSLMMYERHNEWVMENVPKEQLLVHNAKDGWEPLCRFLNVPVPEGEYPRVNDNEAMQRYMIKWFHLGLKRWGMVLVALVVALVSLYWYRK